jgi:hypothetical protein
MATEDRLSGVESRLQEVGGISSDELADIRRMQTGFESAGNTLAAQTAGLASEVEELKTQPQDILMLHTGRLEALEKSPRRGNSGGGKTFVKAILDAGAIVALI